MSGLEDTVESAGMCENGGSSGEAKLVNELVDSTACIAGCNSAANTVGRPYARWEIDIVRGNDGDDWPEAERPN
jgi:hypothetical protein